MFENKEPGQCINPWNKRIETEEIISSVTGNKYREYLASPIHGEEYLYNVLELMSDAELLYYEEYGIKVCYEVRANKDKKKPPLIIKPKNEQDIAYINKLPELVKLSLRTQQGIVTNNPLFQLINRLFSDLQIGETKFRSKQFDDCDNLYNFISWDLIGYEGLVAASFSYTIMNNLTIGRDRVLLNPKVIAHHLNPINYKKLEHLALVNRSN